MKILNSALALVLLASCATSPVPYYKASPVSTSNLLDGYDRYSQPKEGSIRVIVVRDSGMLGTVAPVKLSIDGIAVAKLWPSQGIELFLAPQDYIFAIEPSPRLSGALVEREVVIKSGKSYAFRISLDWGGAFSLQQSTHLQ